MKMMDEETSNTVVPFIMGLDEGYFNQTALIPIVQSNSIALSTGFGGTAGDNVAYQIPANAAGKKLYDVSVLTADGSMVALPLVSPWQVGRPTISKWGCWIEDDKLYLFPAGQFNTYSYIQLVYPAAPLALCDDTGTAGLTLPNAAQVSAVNSVSGAVTVTPTLPASFTVGADLNFVRQTPTFPTTIAATILTIGGSQFTINPALLTDAYGRPTVAVGDWVANLGYSPFLQLPAEGRNLVTQATIVKVLQALKDDGWKDAQTKYQAMELAAHKLFSPRINDSPKVLSSFGTGVGAWRRYRLPGR